MKLKLIVIFILIFQIASTKAEETDTYSFSFLILDAQTNKSVSSADILISEKKSSYTTDENGELILSDFKLGRYHIEISKIGYKTYHYDIIIDSSLFNTCLIFRIMPISFSKPTVIVTGSTFSSKYDEIFSNIANLEGKELQREMGMSLASTLKNEVGVSIRSMGPAPARPVIRGLGGNRIMISQDGNDISDLSGTSPDHSVTLEPFNVERIEVIRGPKVLLYTPITIGGVVNVVKNDLPYQRSEKTTGMVSSFLESANRGFLGAYNITVPFEPYYLFSNLSYKKANDIRMPDSILKNTSLNTLDYTFGTALNIDSVFASVSYSEFDSKYGIPGGFVGGHPKGVNIEMFKRTIGIKNVTHLHYDLIDNIELQFGRVYYNHKEFESNNSLGAEFVFTNYNGSVIFNQNRTKLFDNGSFGASFNIRDLKMGGYVFTPPTTSSNFSFYTYQNISFDNIHLYFGLRYDYTGIQPKPKSFDSKIGRIEQRNFNTISASASILTEITDEFALAFNLSRSNRPPTIEELFSEGPHLAAYSFDIGNPNLKSEYGYGLELTSYYKQTDFKFSFSTFAYLMPYYIIPRNTGKINYAQILPIYQTEGVPANLFGAEIIIDYFLNRNLNLNTNFSYTYGELAESRKPLPMIPPLKSITTLEWKNTKFNLGLRITAALSQKRVDEFEEPTNGYIIFGAFAQYTFPLFDFVSNISLIGENLTDKVYRNHLSRIKSVYPEAGINIKLAYKAYF
ncbi:MAG: TonB-dependent receptor [Candidatus Kapabacteria bacterium]|nr:TonB-dependent receptor [Candidatus Kapabacteria bacterium]